MNIKGYTQEVQTKVIEYKDMKITVKDRIPYADKQVAAQELVEKTTVMDERLGITYTLPTYDLVENYIFLKYYTDLDVSDIQTEDDYRALFEFAYDAGLTESDMREFVCQDIKYLKAIEGRYRVALAAVFEEERSLGHQVKQLLDTSPDTNNEETRELIEKLIDMKGALLEKENKPANGMNVGGTVINFAKKPNH
jgi:hypothetical protein